jgi:hypothetical protein
MQLKNNTMTKIYSFLILAIVFASNVKAQNIPSYVPKDGLVGWYPFNGNANDESGNGNHGSVNGATLITDRSGNANSAYFFDNDSIKIKIKNLLINSSSLSFSGWFKSNIKTNEFGFPDLSGQQIVPDNAYIFKYGNTKEILGSSIQKNGYLNLYYNKYLNSNNYVNFSLTYETFHANNWNFITITYNGDTLKTYINGTYYKPQNKSKIKFNVIDSLITVGKMFNGTIDDISIHKRALTINEVEQLFYGQPRCQTSNVKIELISNGVLCEGTPVNLKTLNKIGRSYSWYLNNVKIENQNKSIIEVSKYGNYSVVISDGNCFEKSDQTNIYFQSLPNKTIGLSTKTPIICEKDSVILSTYAKGDYLWNTGEKSMGITVFKQGKYYAKITNECGTITSDTINIIVNPIPNGIITMKANKTICDGDTVFLEANGGTLYKWSNGSDQNKIGVNKSGYYSVTIQNSYGCPNYLGQNVFFNAKPKMSFDPLKSILFKSDSPIMLSGYPKGGSYTGDGVIGSTFYPSLAKSGKKSISYELVSDLGCKNSITMSTIIVDTNENKCINYDTILKIKFKLTTGIKANQYTSLLVYPNPTSDILVFELSDLDALKAYKYRIMDLVGKEVYNAPINSMKTEIPLKTLGAKGMYVLNILDANNVSIQAKQIVLE